MYSLCWLTISKVIVILNPFKVERFLTHKRCYFIIGMNWIIGCVLALGNFTMDIPWNTVRCTYGRTDETSMKIGYLAVFLMGVTLLPVSLLVYGTFRIFIVVIRTHRQILALENSVAVGENSIGNTGFVTFQAIRSSSNVFIIYVVSLILDTPIIVFALLDILTAIHIPHVFSSVSAWLFQTNTFMNSLLYLVLFKCVRKKVVHMCCAIIVYIRPR